MKHKTPRSLKGYNSYNAPPALPPPKPSVDYGRDLERLERLERPEQQCKQCHGTGIHTNHGNYINKN